MIARKSIHHKLYLKREDLQPNLYINNNLILKINQYILKMIKIIIRFQNKDQKINLKLASKGQEAYSKEIEALLIISSWICKDKSKKLWVWKKNILILKKLKISIHKIKLLNMEGNLRFLNINSGETRNQIQGLVQYKIITFYWIRNKSDSIKIIKYLAVMRETIIKSKTIMNFVHFTNMMIKKKLTNYKKYSLQIMKKLIIFWKLQQTNCNNFSMY